MNVCAGYPGQLGPPVILPPREMGNGIPRFTCSAFADHVAPVLALVGLLIVCCLAIPLALTRPRLWRSAAPRTSFAAIRR